MSAPETSRRFSAVGSTFRNCFLQAASERIGAAGCSCFPSCLHLWSERIGMELKDFCSAADFYHSPRRWVLHLQNNENIWQEKRKQKTENLWIQLLRRNSTERQRGQNEWILRKQNSSYSPEFDYLLNVKMKDLDENDDKVSVTHKQTFWLFSRSKL